MLIFFILLYLAATLSIGFFASRRISNAGDFLNAGRGLHPAVNTAALFALWFGSETIFGASAEFAEHGLRGVIEEPLGGVLCLLLVGLFYARRLYRLNVYTIGDVFRQQYDAKTELLSAVLMILTFVGYAGAQIVALGLITQTLLGISLPASMIMSACIVVSYTFVGGMWAVSLTDFVQSIFIVLGLGIISWFVTEQVGGAGVVLDSIPAEHKQFFPESGAVAWTNWFAAWMVLGFGSIASQDIFQRVNSARSERAAVSSTILGALLYLVLAVVPLYLVSAAKILDPTLLEGDLQLALPTMVMQTMPVWVQILFFGALFSAIMSTCSGALLAPASILSENILKHNVLQKLSADNSLLVTRLSVLAMGIVALGMAFNSQNIFELVGEASTFGLVSLFVPFTATLFFNHRSVPGALTSMLLGTVTWIFFHFVYEIAIMALIPGFGASVLGLWLGSWLDKALSPQKRTA